MWSSVFHASYLFFQVQKSPLSQRASYTVFHRLSESSPYKGEKTLVGFQA